MKHNYEIAVIPGDGIGPEIISESQKILNLVASKFGIDITWNEYPFGAEYYLKTKELLPESVLIEMKDMDAIFFGAVGDPRIEPGILSINIIHKIRHFYDQFINLRSIKLYKKEFSPLKGKTPKDIDFFVVRENTEDFYLNIGGKVKTKKEKQYLEIKSRLYKLKVEGIFNLESEEEIAYNIGVISKEGTERVVKYAFELARKKKMKRVSSVDKANVLTHMYGLWRDIFRNVAEQYKEIKSESVFVDAITMYFIQKPEWYDVVVAPNMFGDIITDLSAALIGGLGLLPSANIGSELSMFEPGHGSAPDIAGKNIANPIATILSGAMMFDHLGRSDVALFIEKVVRDVLVEGKKLTRDLGGNCSTSEIGNYIIEKMRKSKD